MRKNVRRNSVKLIVGVCLLVMGGATVAGAAGGASETAITLGQVVAMAGGVAAAVVGYAWMMGITVREFIGRIFEPEREESKHESIRHYNGRRNYGQAAVFIGTACLFMGTPQQCDELCDDLWHYGQQAHMEMLSGEETLEVL